MVPAEQQQALDFVKSDAQLHNRGQRLLVVPTGFAANLNNTKNASVQLYIDKSDQASASLAGVVNAATASYATELSPSNPNNVIDNVNVKPQSIITRNVRSINFFLPALICRTLLTR